MIMPVADEVYRSPRPTLSQYAEIKSKFKRVISLEGLAEDLKECEELSPVWVLSEPITFIQIYFTGISQERLNWILGEIEAAISFGPCLVHCQHGEDRTGLVIAAYRVRHCGWSKVAAMREALDLGYRGWLNRGLNKTWEKFA